MAISDFKSSKVLAAISFLTSLLESKHILNSLMDVRQRQSWSEQKFTKNLLGRTAEFIYAVLMALSIPIAFAVMHLVSIAIALRRSYIRALKFMENTVTRVKEVKRIT